MLCSYKVRSFGMLALILFLAPAIYGFAAANVVPESGAGDGLGTISGYTISTIRYTLNATNPRNIDSVGFNIAPTAGASAPTTVTVQLNDAGSWFSCSNVSGNNWSCTLTGQTVLDASSLRVVAAE